MVSVSVSVIVTFKDEERFLLEAVDSVFRQSSDDWELLLIDDGSSDGSSEIARQQVGRRPSRVRYLQHGGGANRGISASRNLGMAHAGGKYVAYLDADDVWLPSKLADQMELMSAHPDVGLLYGPVQAWYSWAGEGARQPDSYYDLGVSADTVIPPPKLLPQLIRNKYQTPVPSGSILSRRVLEQVGGNEAAFPLMYEDQALFTKVLTVSHAYVASRCWTRYRQRDDSVSAQFEQLNTYYEGRLPYLEWTRTYLRSSGVRDASVWRTLRRELFKARHPEVMRVRHGLARRFRSVVPAGAG